MLHSGNKVAVEALEHGLSAHREGRFDEAIDAYRDALTAAPDDAETQSLLGLALVHRGRAEEALPLLNQAVATEPSQMGFRFNLAEGLMAMRDPAGAAVELQLILANNPGSFQIWDRLGDAAALRQDADGAARAWRKAFELGSKLPTGLKLARLEISASHLDAAEITLKQLSAHFPDEAALIALRCDYLTARRDWFGLHAAALSWARVQPGTHEAWRALARAAFETGRYREAVLAFQRVLAAPAPGVDDVAAYAGLQLHAGDFEAAAATLDRVAAIAPDHPGMLARRALLHLYYGRFDAALDCSRRSLAQDAENVSAYVTLGRVLRGRLSHQEIEVLGRIASRPTAAPDLRIPAAFTLAHAEDARADTDAAFAAYEFAQSLALERDRQEGRAYQAAASEARFRQLARLRPTRSAAAAQDPSGKRPIFIVGMPRSGTTLIECVLGAHSRVFACGERTAMRQVLRAALELDANGRVADEATLRTWIAGYLAELPDLGSADHFTDKHPLNFEALGLIASLFPDAVILHVRRNPVETCLSVYRQEFSKPWAFAHRLEDIGHFYGQQARLMAHWQRQLPGRVRLIQYEQFAADIAASARELVESLGLAWQPDCAAFQQTTRAIATFSTVEARGPVTVRNNRAVRYQRHLAPLQAALRSADVDLATGAFVGEAGMHDSAAG